ncbi:MAG: dipeptide epimerase [Phycisphaerales bacterium]|nr:dipeptide epimerase [Phycisphaerales bacterium]MCB9856668.1 dipeptide epimerase [Phycisphaerales bacterium]MCB9862205.1 dipeptide epimerase [Phycisphaerales bacterium]
MHVSWTRLNLRQAVPFRTAKAVRTDKQTLQIHLQYQDVVGWGEAAPTDTYRQDLASAERTLQAIAPKLRGRNPFHLETILNELIAQHPDQLATVAAIDAALHDWIGKKLGIPVVHLLGIDERTAPKTSYTLGIDDPESIAGRALRAAQYPVFKLKTGGPDDIAMLRAIRNVAPDKPIRLDANAAWTCDQAIENIRELATFGIEFVEQPLPAADYDGLARVRAAVNVPIVADESCVTIRDIPKCAGCVDGVNIKLSKCGGIREAHKMIHVARALGLKVMLGCMIESELGIAAAAQLAPLADWIDLDGHLLLADGPFEGLNGANGRLTIGRGPGLGVRPRS